MNPLKMSESSSTDKKRVVEIKGRMKLRNA
jgi:hypothetical protein